MIRSAPLRLLPLSLAALPALAFAHSGQAGTEAARETIGGERLVAAVSGQFHGCARNQPGLAGCRGHGKDGWPGGSSMHQRLTPVRARDLTGATQFATGTWHDCAHPGSGAVPCSGSSNRPGDGTRVNQRAPIRVRH